MEYAVEQEKAARVFYQTSVDSIAKSSGGFNIAVVRGGQRQQVACKRVVMANGLWVPNIPAIHGIEHATGYEELASDGSLWEGANVARPPPAP